MLRSGDVVANRYRLESVIGEGGMGCVFAAQPLSGGPACALKVMLGKAKQDDELVRRFLREAKASEAIQSPYVARVYDAGSLEDGSPFMVMELLEGVGLNRVIEEHAPLGIGRSVRFALQTCVGLAAAHAKGLVHRDLKPSNLFVTRAPDGSELLKLLDFGIAKADGAVFADETGTLTATDSVIGSPQFMSPEQLRDSKRVDMRTDVWSLGLLLHTMLSGRKPFEAESVGEHFAMIVSEPPTPLREHWPDAPEVLEGVVRRCLKRDLTSRYQDVAQVARALAPFAEPRDQPLVAETERILAEAGMRSEQPAESALHDSPTDTRTETGIESEVGIPPHPAPDHGARWFRYAAIGGLVVGGIFAATLVRVVPPAEGEATTDGQTVRAATPVEASAAGAGESATPEAPSAAPSASSPSLAAVPPARAPGPLPKATASAPASPTADTPPHPPARPKAKGPLITADDLGAPFESDGK